VKDLRLGLALVLLSITLGRAFADDIESVSTSGCGTTVYDDPRAGWMRWGVDWQLASPNGKLLAEQIRLKPWGEEDDPVFVLLVRDLGNGCISLLSKDRTDSLSCLWSPDSEKLLVNNHRYSNLDTAYVYDIRGTMWTELRLPQSTVERLARCSCELDQEKHTDGECWLSPDSVAFSSFQRGLGCSVHGQYIYHIGGSVETSTEFVSCAGSFKKRSVNQVDPASSTPAQSGERNTRAR